MQDDNPAEKTANEIRAAARDMLRMGSRWAHSALDWIDDRRHEMSNRTRDEGDHGDHGRSASSSYSAEGQRDWQTRDRQERDRQERQDRLYGGRREQLQGRSDRDIQGDFSGGGYDQVGERDWSRSDTGSDHGQHRAYGYGREGYSSSRTQSLDDSGRGLSGSDLGYGSTGGYGSASAGFGAGPGGVGYGAPGYGAGSSYAESRYHGDFQSRAIGDDEGYGSYGREAGYGSEFGRDLGQGRHWHARQGEGYGNPLGSQRAYGTERDYGREPGYGRSGQSYGERGYRSSASDFGSRGHGQSGLSQRGAHDYSNYLQGSGYGAQGTTGTSGRNYRGVGPRNYTRSDERIREDLNERLTDAHDIDASMLTVEVNNGVATLTGTVDERWMKHRAEDIADGCTGVRDVRNNIQVQSSGSDRSSPAGGTLHGGTQGDRQDAFASNPRPGASGQYGSSQQDAGTPSSAAGTPQASGSSSYLDTNLPGSTSGTSTSSSSRGTRPNV